MRSALPFPRLIRDHAGPSMKKTCLPSIPILKTTFADHLGFGKLVTIETVRG